MGAVDTIFDFYKNQERGDVDSGFIIIALGFISIMASFYILPTNWFSPSIGLAAGAGTYSGYRKWSIYKNRRNAKHKKYANSSREEQYVLLKKYRKRNLKSPYPRPESQLTEPYSKSEQREDLIGNIPIEISYFSFPLMIFSTVMYITYLHVQAIHFDAVEKPKIKPPVEIVMKSTELNSCKFPNEVETMSASFDVIYGMKFALH